MKQIKVAVFGAGNRGNAYGEYALLHPNELKVVAFAELAQEKRDIFQQKHNIPNDMVFDNWQEVLNRPKFCDAILICIQDADHKDAAIKAMELGYDLLLEKPIANNWEDCVQIEQKAIETGRTVMVCHVLRYTHFFKTIKRLIDAGKVGEIVSINHTESVNYWHQAHAFVRGNWRNSNETSPMILAKSCHDLDILNWLTGKKCKKIASFGSLKHFKAENAPVGSSLRCSTCEVEENCPYSAYKLYLHTYEYPTNMLTTDLTPAGVIKAIKEGPYGRCVYHCDNNVVDNQVVAMEYEDGISVNFTMCAFNFWRERDINIMGTRGQIIGGMAQGIVEVHNFLDKSHEQYKTQTGAGHGGGDTAIMKSFVKVMNGDTSESASDISVSTASHKMAFIAEQARLTGKVIEV